MENNIETKRRIFLEQLEQHCEKLLNLEEGFTNYGIRGKIKRLILFPNIYIPFYLSRIGIYRKKTRKVKLFFGKEILVKGDDAESFGLARAGCLLSKGEIRLTKFFIKNLKENDVFYDIGANLGFYTYLALEFCKEVHSFEPLPDIFQYLERNLKNKSNVFLNNVAVSDKEGETDLQILEFYSGGNTINKNLSSVLNIKYEKKIKVATIALDNYLKNNSKPTIMKIDVEGAESLVIDGAKNFLKNNDTIISLEVWPLNKGGEISMLAVEKLRNFGYQSFFINKNGDLEKIDGNLATNIDNGENFIFLKNDRQK